MTAGALIIERIRAGATVQDGGRPGHMHEGVPPGEPLVPELFAAANASLGNEPGAAALELPNADALFRVAGEVTVSIDGRPRTLTGSERFQLGAEGEAVRYVALPGGVDVPVVLGGRGTLWVATMGGHEGRILKSGDELRPRLVRPATVTDVHPALSRPEALIRVVPGPDSFDRAVLDAFLSSPFRVGAAGRVGMRLVGTRLPVDGVDADGSRPLVRGAIQITTDGWPIVMGPDHPTTGGYRVIATIISADLGLLARRPAGAEVRFTAVSAPPPPSLAAP